MSAIHIIETVDSSDFATKRRAWKLFGLLITIEDILIINQFSRMKKHYVTVTFATSMVAVTNIHYGSATI